jgi:hypothetical protein
MTETRGGSSTPDRSPPTPSARHIALWIDVMEASEQFLLAGLRRKIGAEGELRAAYRAWYERQMEEHDRMIRRMALRIQGRSDPDDR